MAYDRRQVLKTEAVGMYVHYQQFTETSQYTLLQLGYIIPRRPHMMALPRVPEKRDPDSKAHHEEGECGGPSR